MGVLSSLPEPDRNNSGKKNYLKENSCQSGGREMNKSATLFVALIILAVVAGIIRVHEKKYHSEIIIVGKYQVKYYTSFEEIPTSQKLEELQDHPAVQEISWSELTKKSRQYRQYKWTSGEGFVLDGVLSAEI